MEQIRRIIALTVLAAVALAAGECSALEQATLAVNGVPRTYLIARPAAPGPKPTILMLHGSNGSGAGAAQATRLPLGADREGFVAVFPEGVAHQWNIFPTGQAPQRFLQRAQFGGGVADDVAFLRTLVLDLVRRGVSDPKRVYLAGFSMGGMMALRMACLAPELFAGVGVVSSSMSEPAGRECTNANARALPIIAMHGTADPVVPYSGGPLRNGTNVWGIERTLAFFRRLDRCAEQPQYRQLPHSNPADRTHVTVIRWSNCLQGEVLLYRIDGGVHRIPGAHNIGPVDLKGGEALWTFFRDKSRS